MNLKYSEKHKYAIMIPIKPTFKNIDTINSEFIFVVDCSG
jgi:hypothetical protein